MCDCITLSRNGDMAPRGKRRRSGAAVRASMGGLARSRSAPFQARRAEARCRHEAGDHDAHIAARRRVSRRSELTTESADRTRLVAAAARRRSDRGLVRPHVESDYGACAHVSPLIGDVPAARLGPAGLKRRTPAARQATHRGPDRGPDRRRLPRGAMSPFLDSVMQSHITSG